MPAINLDRKQLLEFAHEQFSDKKELLKKNINELSTSALQNLHQLNEHRSALQSACRSYGSNLKQAVKPLFDSFMERARGIDGQEDAQESIIGLFRETIWEAIEVAATQLSRESSGIKLYGLTKTILQQTTNILQGVLDFKNTVDKIYPHLSDTLTSLSVPTITIITAISVPPVGTALQVTGILNKTAEFLKTENLTQTIENMNNNLDRIKEKKELAEAHYLGEQLAQLSQITEIPPENLQRLDINSKDCKAFKKEIEKNPKVVEFLREISNYAENHLLNSEQKIQDFFQEVKKEAIEELREQNAPEHMIEDLSKNYDGHMKETQNRMVESMQKASGLFDKIAIMIHGLENFRQKEKFIENELIAKYPEQKTQISKAIKQADTKVEKRVQGNIPTINKMMQNNPKIKKLAKTNLGSKISNEVILNKNKTIGRSL